MSLLKRWLKRWKFWIPVLTWAGIAAGFVVQRVFAPLPDEFVIQPPPAAKIPPLELPERIHSLEGQVVDPDGAAVAGALVWLRAGDVPHFAYTDSEGRFLFPALESAPWHASVIARGFAPLVREFPAAESGLTIRLGAPFGPAPALPPVVRAKLTGSVASRLAIPFEGSEVVLVPTSPPETLSGPLPRRTSIAPDGRFEFEDLIVGEYRVEVRPAWGRGGSWPDLARAIDGAEPRVFRHSADGDARGLAIELQTGEVTGRLLAVDGRPIEGALVLLSPGSDASRVFPPASSAADGAFAVGGLPAGDYVIAIRAGSAAVQKDARIRAGESTNLEIEPLEVHRAQ